MWRWVACHPPPPAVTGRTLPFPQHHRAGSRPLPALPPRTRADLARWQMPSQLCQFTFVILVNLFTAPGSLPEVTLRRTHRTGPSPRSELGGGAAGFQESPRLCCVRRGEPSGAAAALGNCLRSQFPTGVPRTSHPPPGAEEMPRGKLAHSAKARAPLTCHTRLR